MHCGLVVGTYKTSPAEKVDLPNSNVDFISIAQAIHWFKFDKFFDECVRVSKKNAIIAAYGYAFHHTGDERIDLILEHFGKTILAPFWQPEPKLIWNGYRDIPWPFKSVSAPEFSLDVQWNLNELVGYYSSWSATQSYINQNKQHPIELVWADLEKAWGDKIIKRRLSAPLALKVGQI